MCGTLCGCQVREGRPEKGGERQYEPTTVIVHGVWFVGRGFICVVGIVGIVGVVGIIGAVRVVGSGSCC